MNVVVVTPVQDGKRLLFAGPGHCDRPKWAGQRHEQVRNQFSCNDQRRCKPQHHCCPRSRHLEGTFLGVGLMSWQDLTIHFNRCISQKSLVSFIFSCKKYTFPSDFSGGYCVCLGKCLGDLDSLEDDFGLGSLHGRLHVAGCGRRSLPENFWPQENGEVIWEVIEVIKIRNRLCFCNKNVCRKDVKRLDFISGFGARARNVPHAPHVPLKSWGC